MIVRSPDMSKVLYRIPVWHTGNPIAIDPNPNTTEPDPTRCVLYEVPGAVMLPQSAFLRILAVGGTSVTYSLWKWDPYFERWFQAIAAGLNSRTMTLANGNVDFPSNIGGVGSGMKWFVQVTAQVGGVTAFGYGLV